MIANLGTHSKVTSVFKAAFAANRMSLTYEGSVGESQSLWDDVKLRNRLLKQMPVPWIA